MGHMTCAARRGILAAGMVLMLVASAVQAAGDRAKIEQFLEVTGFDVALESLRQSAGSAPTMLGMDASVFGTEWTRMTEEVFDVDLMHDLALQMLEPNLSADMLDHANDFYATGLGRRLVDAENASHLVEDEAAKAEAGQAIVAGLVRLGSDRVSELRRMNAAVDSSGSAVRALQEIQVRFLMAAAGAGVVRLKVDEPDLRERLASQRGTLRRAIQASALSGAAYTYQAFSDDEVKAYADALEHPVMKRVYELMNAVQYEILANRFEELAVRMSALQPSTDL